MEVSEVEKWLKKLPEKSIEKELDQLRQEAQSINKEIEIREQALQMKRSFVTEAQQLSGTASEIGQMAGGVRALNPPFLGREAIRRVIAETPGRKAWTIPDMLAAIHRRGWTANTHAVQVNLSRMYRDGELGKAAKGIYLVPDGPSNLPASSSEAMD